MQTALSRTHPTIGRWIAAEVVRYLAFTQSGMLVGLHFGWIMLVVIGSTGMVDGVKDGREEIGAQFFEAVRWLGGMDADGHGDLDSMLALWGKVSLILFLPKLLWDVFGGERPPWPFLRKLAVSTALMAVGYVAGFALVAMQAKNDPDIGGFVMIWAVFVAFGAASGAWAFAAGLLGETIARHLLGSPPPRPVAIARLP